MKVETFNRIIDLAIEKFEPEYHEQLEEYRKTGLSDEAALEEQPESRSELEIKLFAHLIIEHFTTVLTRDEVIKNLVAALNQQGHIRVMEVKITRIPRRARRNGKGKKEH